MEKYGVQRGTEIQEEALRQAIEREKIRLARERELSLARQIAKESASHATSQERKNG